MIAILQFTKVFDEPNGHVIVGTLGVAIAICIVASEICLLREERKRTEADQEFRRQVLQYVNGRSQPPRPPVLEASDNVDIVNTPAVQIYPSQDQIQAAQETLFANEALMLPPLDLRVKLAHDPDFRRNFEAIALGKYPALAAIKKGVAREPLIAARFTRSRLIPRHPYAEITKDLMKALNKPFTATSDFLFEIHLVNTSDNPTTVQKITAEAEINGNWVVLPEFHDLGHYEIVFDDDGEGQPKRRLSKPDEADVKQLSSIWLELRGKELRRGVGVQGWIAFEISADSNVFDKPVMNRVRLVDALGGLHPVITSSADPPDKRGRLRYSPKVLEELRRS